MDPIAKDSLLSFHQNIFLDECHDFEWSELGFPEKEIRPKILHFFLFIDSFEIAIHDDNRTDTGIVLQCMEYLESIHMWHHDIEYDHCRIRLDGTGDTTESVSCFMYRIALGSEGDHIHFSNIVIVLDDQYWFCEGIMSCNLYGTELIDSLDEFCV